MLNQNDKIKTIRTNLFWIHNRFKEIENLEQDLFNACIQARNAKVIAIDPFVSKLVIEAEDYSCRRIYDDITNKFDSLEKLITMTPNCVGKNKAMKKLVFYKENRFQPPFISL